MPITQLDLFPEKEVRVQVWYSFNRDVQLLIHVKANSIVITSTWCSVTSLIEAFPIIGKCIVAIYENRHDVGYIEVEEWTWEKWRDPTRWPANTDFDYGVPV